MQQSRSCLHDSSTVFHVNAVFHVNPTFTQILRPVALQYCPATTRYHLRDDGGSKSVCIVSWLGRTSQQSLTASRRFEEDELIDIVLEDGKKTYRVQKALLCTASDYFTGPLNSSFKESTSRTLRLPGCDITTFQLFLDWLCHRQLPNFDEYTPDMEFTEKEQGALVRLWSFAEEHLMPKLQNAAMKELLATLESFHLMPGAVRVAFDTTSSDSIMRRMVVEEAVCDYELGRKAHREEMDEFGAIPGFMLSFVECMQDRSNGDCDGLGPSRRPQNWHMYYVAER